MKLLLTFSLWCLTVGTVPANEKLTDSPTSVAASAKQFFGTLRSDVAGGIEGRLKNKAISPKDLDAILAALDDATNKLHKAGFVRKLDFAARQVDTIRTQVVAVLKDPANKSMAAGLEPQEWLDEIALQKSTATVLEGDIARLRGTIHELRQWAALMEPVAPADQVASKLKSRLAELLNQWRRPATRQEPHKADRPADNRVVQAKPDSSANEDLVNDSGRTANSPQALVSVRFTRPGGSVYKTVQVSSGVAAVLRLAGNGTAEDQVLRFIDKSAGPFILTADQIIAIREIVCSHILSAMIRRDTELRATAAR